MENDTFALGLRQSCEVEDSFARNGWTNQDVKKFTERDFAASVLTVIRGQATIQALPPVEQAPANPFKFNVFRTIKGGGERKSPKNLKKALEKDGYSIGTYAEQILQKVTVPQTETEVDLVVATPRDLGFTENARFDAICERAISLGLELSPDWVGPELRLQYAAQPMGEWLVIAMEPLTGSDGVLRLFGVEHGSDGLWLRSDGGYPDRVWSLDGRVVFVRPRK